MSVYLLALSFSVCSFIWVCRETNLVAHELAKPSAVLGSPFICNANSLIPSVKETWLRDALCVGLSVQ